MEAMAVAAFAELVACRKISVKGKPVGVVRTASKLPRPKRVARRMARPRRPLMRREVGMERGTAREGLGISSNIFFGG